MSFESMFGGTMIMIVLITGFSIVLGVGLPAVIFFFIWKKNQERAQLVATGVPGQAMVVQMADTGMRINNQPHIALTLDVHPIAGYSNFAPFRTTHNATIPMMAMSRVSPGVALPVKCDPMNPTRLTIDWGAMGFVV